MGGIASQITSLTIVYSIIYSGADQRKRLCAWNSVTRKIFPFDDVIMWSYTVSNWFTNLSTQTITDLDRNIFIAATYFNRDLWLQLENHVGVIHY